MSRLIDLAQLPPPQAVETLSYEDELSAMKADLISMFSGADQASVIKTLALESEPMTKLLQVFAYRVILIRQEFNDRSKKLLLAFARGAELDHIGSTYYQAPRLTLVAGNSTTVPPIDAVMESDDAYLNRLLLAADSYSTAGPEKAYQFHALSAHSSVLDVTAKNAGGGKVLVTVLSSAGTGSPSPEVLAAVESALSAEMVRPLNDTVIVSPAAIRTYQIRARVTSPSGPTSEAILAESQKNAEAYVARRRLIGQSIIRDAVLSAIWGEQVEHVQLLEPVADLAAEPGVSWYCTGIELTS